MKYLEILSILSLISILVVSGCVGQSTTQNTSSDIPMDKAVEMMKDMINNKPEMMNTTNDNLVMEDQNFTAGVLKKGMFENLNYMTSGSVYIEEKAGKKYVVLQDDFSTPDGPDLVLYLTKNSDKTTRDDVKAGIELQKLKSTKGMQIYEIPVGIDLSQYNSVTIHCKAFNVPWSYAPLK
ncbi:MAG: DM13 domain-containing protein [Candidatus Aenigmarchaeota archaeon]|nr:DM13 domain-containing protein [Candidatus Aenigmarchaeota archaeon]